MNATYKANCKVSEKKTVHWQKATPYNGAFVDNSNSIQIKISNFVRSRYFLLQSSFNFPSPELDDNNLYFVMVPEFCDISNNLFCSHFHTPS